jgi:hypothetical protein
MLRRHNQEARSTRPRTACETTVRILRRPLEHLPLISTARASRLFETCITENVPSMHPRLSHGASVSTVLRMRAAIGNSSNARTVANACSEAATATCRRTATKKIPPSTGRKSRNIIRQRRPAPWGLKASLLDAVRKVLGRRRHQISGRLLAGGLRPTVWNRPRPGKFLAWHH